MQFLADFADQAVVLPFVLATAAALWLGGWPRGAMAWTLVCGATLAAVGVAKLAIFIYGPPAVGPALLSPSGHTASAAVVYGGLTGLLFLGGWMRRVAPISIILALIIGTTRLELHEHTLPDVVAGGVIGLAGAMALSAMAGRRPQHFRRLVPIGIGAAVLLGFHGLRMPAETWLKALADTIGRH